MEKMRIRRMTERNLDGVLSLLGEALGTRFVTRSALSTFVDSSEKAGFVSVDQNDRVMGAVTSELLPESRDVGELLPDDARERVVALIPELALNHTCLLRSIAVSPLARGAGVGTDLIRASIEHLHSEGATAVISVGWTDHDGCHVQKPFESVGFEQRGDLEDFWKAESLEMGYQCPTCGSPCGTSVTQIEPL